MLNYTLPVQSLVSRLGKCEVMQEEGLFLQGVHTHKNVNVHRADDAKSHR